jgi:hypothetical protein
MRVAHEEGLNTSATMLIGHIEFVRERLEHMRALRDMQDYALAIDGYSNLLGEDSLELVRRARERWPGVFAASPPPAAIFACRLRNSATNARMATSLAANSALFLSTLESSDGMIVGQ